MGFLFGRKKHAEKPSILAERRPSDDERLGPPPAPARTANAPRVSVHPFAGAPGHLVLAEPGKSRAGETSVLRVDASGSARHATAPGLSAAALALTRARVSSGEPATLETGDLLFAASGAALAIEGVGGPGAVLLDVAPGAGEEDATVRRDELAGRPFPGVTGIRAVRRTAGCVAVRLGPPPGARWVLVGLRSFAVFYGKFSAVDGEESVEVRAGELAVIGDPTATLYLSAGNDSALAIGFASPDLVVALG
jgi:hypothetical protein